MGLGLLLTGGAVTCSLRQGNLQVRLSVAAKNKEDLQFLEKAFCPSRKSKIYGSFRKSTQSTEFQWQTKGVQGYREAASKTSAERTPGSANCRSTPKGRKYCWGSSCYSRSSWATQSGPRNSRSGGLGRHLEPN